MTRVVFICQAMDLNDNYLASAHSWAKSFEAVSDELSVLALRVGKNNLINDPIMIGSKNRFYTTLNFYREIFYIIRKEKGANINFFVYQGGWYSCLLFPLRIFYDFTIFQWKAHPKISFLLKIQVKWINNLTFTSNKLALPIKSNKIRVIGQGADENIFFAENGVDRRDFIVVGRISRSKNILNILTIFHGAIELLSPSTNLKIYGPITKDETAYYDLCKDYIETNKLTDRVFFMGGCAQLDLAHVYRTSKLLINMTDTALDRVVAESMLCGTPVLTSNQVALDVFDDKFNINKIFDKNDISSIQNKLAYFSKMADSDFKLESEKNLVFAKAHFGLNSLIGKIHPHFSR